MAHPSPPPQVAFQNPPTHGPPRVVCKLGLWGLFLLLREAAIMSFKPLINILCSPLIHFCVRMRTVRKNRVAESDDSADNCLSREVHNATVFASFSAVSPDASGSCPWWGTCWAPPAPRHSANTQNQSATFTCRSCQIFAFLDCPIQLTRHQGKTYKDLTYHYCKAVHFSFGPTWREDTAQRTNSLWYQTPPVFPWPWPCRFNTYNYPGFFWQTVCKLLQRKEATGKRRFSMWATGTKGLIVY